MTLINENKEDILKTKDNPLVSIIVITYNSSKYVIETLNSAKDQTYKKIELIISDDCSTDKTVEICKKWIENNKNGFVRTKLVTIDKNGGIPANCNRGIKEARGDWVRFIAGDDALFNEAIEFAVEFVFKNNYVKVFTSNRAIYNNTFSEENLIEISEEIKIKNEKGLYFYNLSATEQYLSLLYSNKVNATGVLINKKFLLEVGGFDERLKLIEDYPLFLKITKYGEKIYCMNKVTTKYRIHNSSVQTLKIDKNSIFNNKYLTKRNFQYIYIYPNINLLNKFIYEFEYYRHYYMDFLNLNRNNFICRSIYFTTSILSPFKLRKFLHRNSIFINVKGWKYFFKKE